MLNKGYPLKAAFVTSVTQRYIVFLLMWPTLMQALHGFNDYYVKGFEPAVSGNRIFVEVQKAIQRLDEQCQRFPRYQKYSNATVVLFKSAIDPVLRGEMVSSGYRFMRKKTNPVVGKTGPPPGSVSV